jgi:hypothetical protein
LIIDGHLGKSFITEYFHNHFFQIPVIPRSKLTEAFLPMKWEKKYSVILSQADVTADSRVNLGRRASRKGKKGNQ